MVHRATRDVGTSCCAKLLIAPRLCVLTSLFPMERSFYLPTSQIFFQCTTVFQTLIFVLSKPQHFALGYVDSLDLIELQVSEPLQHLYHEVVQSWAVL